MADLTVFSFQSDGSLLHRLDVRFKIFFLIFISLISLRGGFLGLSILTGLITVLVIHSRLPVRSACREFRIFLLFLLLILIVRMLTTPGSVLVEWQFLTVSRSGLISGIRVCWRLFIIVLLGFLFVYSTRSSDIKAAAEWYLKPFGFIPAKQVAMMMGLIVRFIPVILNQAKETAAAQRARCMENRKNPYYRLKWLGLPLIRRTFEQADRLIVAMEARCYSENRTDPVLRSTRKDWIALLTLIAVGFWILAI